MLLEIMQFSCMHPQRDFQFQDKYTILKGTGSREHIVYLWKKFAYKWIAQDITCLCCGAQLLQQERDDMRHTWVS